MDRTAERKRMAASRKKSLGLDGELLAALSTRGFRQLLKTQEPRAQRLEAEGLLVTQKREVELERDTVERTFARLTVVGEQRLAASRAEIGIVA